MENITMHRSLRRDSGDPSPTWDEIDSRAPVDESYPLFDRVRRTPLRQAVAPRRIDLSIRGEGSTLLFIPGSFNTGAAWRPIQARCRCLPVWLR
jgi:hypothetical protein